MAKDIADKSKERMKILNQFNQTAAMSQGNDLQAQKSGLFNNLLDDSLLSDGEGTERNEAVVNMQNILDP